MSTRFKHWMGLAGSMALLLSANAYMPFILPNARVVYPSPACANVQAMPTPVLDMQKQKPGANAQKISPVMQKQKQKAIKQKQNTVAKAKKKAVRSPYLSCSSRERELFAKVVWLEAGVQSYRCKEMVASAVANRVKSRQWGCTLAEVIYSPCQFSCAGSISNTRPYRCDDRGYERSAEFRNNWDECFRAVDKVCKTGPSVPKYVLYFCSESPFDWEGYNHYAYCDGMYFGYLTQDAQRLN